VESSIIGFGLLLAAWAFMIFCMRETLRLRPRARLYRAKFIEAANDLVGKAEFPHGHAEHLLMLASFRPGWVTRGMVLMLAKRAILGGRDRKGALKFESIPESLRARYVTAILAFALADSYHSAAFGRVFRTINSWMIDGVRDVKPDVGAHATRRVIEQVDHAHAPRRKNEVFACA
jgi:hypothetical protein